MTVDIDIDVDWNTMDDTGLPWTFVDAAASQRYGWTMTDAKQVIEEEETALDAEDRVWLDEQLDRYSELLTYLREH